MCVCDEMIAFHRSHNFSKIEAVIDIDSMEIALPAQVIRMQLTLHQLLIDIISSGNS